MASGTQTGHFKFFQFFRNENFFESFILIFDSSLPKGFSWQNMKDFEIWVLSPNSRFLRKGALKHISQILFYSNKNSVYLSFVLLQVDPTRTASGGLESNKRTLSHFVEKAWNYILCSTHNFPRWGETSTTLQQTESKNFCVALCCDLTCSMIFSDLQETFYELRRKCTAQGKSISTKLIRWGN